MLVISFINWCQGFGNQKDLKKKTIIWSRKPGRYKRQCERKPRNIYEAGHDRSSQTTGANTEQGINNRTTVETIKCMVKTGT